MSLFLTGCVHLIRPKTPVQSSNEPSPQIKHSQETLPESEPEIDKLSIQAQAAPSLDLSLVSISDYRFSMDIPNGWEYMTNPTNLDFGIIAYDPQVPERMIFYYYALEPFMKSDAARDFFKFYYADSSMYSNCPVLSSFKVEEMFVKWNEYLDFLDKYNAQAAVKRFDKIEILESFPL